MFTGIVEGLGKVEEITVAGSNRTYKISSDISNELKVDQSIAHNGVCLTVEEIGDGWHSLTAVKETLSKSNIRLLRVDELVNLERCMRLNDRLDGHIVQGHVDDTGICTNVKDENGSWIYSFSFNSAHSALLINKGSITVNGVSLTIVNCTEDIFQVAIVPFTYQNTNFKFIERGSIVNLEFDILGKYIQKSMQLSTESRLSDIGIT